MATGFLGTFSHSAASAQARRCARLRSISRTLALVGASVGLLVLAGGWLLDVSLLRSIIPGAASMKVNTALGLMLTAGAILADRGHAQTLRRLLPALCGAFLVLLSSATLLEDLTRRNFGIDELLVVDRTSTPPPAAPGRIAVVTAIAFLLLGCAMLVRNYSRKLHWDQFLAAAAAILCLANLVGYFYGIANFAGIVFYTGMAVHTSSSLLILSLAMLFSEPDRGLMALVSSDYLGGVLTRRLLPAALLVPVLLGWLTWQGELQGLYGTAFGVALFATSNVAVFAFLIWTSGRQLNGLDRDNAQATARLQAREDLLSVFVKRVPAAVAMLDRGLRYLQVSDRWCSEYRLNSSEVLGRSHFDVFPDIPDRWKPILNRCLAGEALQEEEDRWDRASGESIWLRWEIRPWGESNGLPEGILILAENITQRKREELELRKFVSLADNSVEFIGMCDTNFMPFYANQAALQLVGLDSLEQALRTPVPDFFFPEDRRFIVEEFFPRVFREGRAEVEIRFRHFKTGEPLWMIYNVFHIKDAAGRPAAFATVSRDITARKQAETALRDSERQLRALAGSLITAQEDERRRLSRELHDDITQQLAFLSIELGKLAGQNAGPLEETRARVRALQDQALRMSNEVRRLSHGLHPSVIEDFGLSVALEEFCDEYSRAHGVHVRFEGLVEDSQLSREGATCLYRLVQECLRNAVAHGRATEVCVGLTADAASIHLRVRDNGIGFAADGGRSKAGLGIVSMRERIRLVNGTLQFSSQPGQGAEITASVPLTEGVH